MVVVHFLAHAVTEAFELAESEHIIHEHVVLLEDVFDHELEKGVHVVVLRVAFVHVEQTDWLLLILWGVIARLVVFEFVRGCSEKAAGCSGHDDVGASLQGQLQFALPGPLEVAQVDELEAFLSSAQNGDTNIQIRSSSPHA